VSGERSVDLHSGPGSAAQSHQRPCLGPASGASQLSLGSTHDPRPRRSSDVRWCPVNHNGPGPRAAGYLVLDKVRVETPAVTLFKKSESRRQGAGAATWPKLELGDFVAQHSSATVLPWGDDRRQRQRTSATATLFRQLDSRHVEMLRACSAQRSNNESTTHCMASTAPLDTRGERRYGSTPATKPAQPWHTHEHARAPEAAQVRGRRGRPGRGACRR
jgi:hypothetical protein